MGCGLEWGREALGAAEVGVGPRVARLGDDFLPHQLVNFVVPLVVGVEALLVVLFFVLLGPGHQILHQPKVLALG